jgi:hypothetical protein
MSKRIKCPECNGECQLEYERWVPRSFQDDVGGYETYTRNCDNCGVTVKYLMRRRMRYDNLLDSVGFDYVCGRASDAKPLVVPVYKGVRCCVDSGLSHVR